MSYSDDTAEFMAYGRPTMTELLAHQQARKLCESCRSRPAVSNIGFGDGTRFDLCAECRPFNPADVVVLTDTSSDDQIPPSY